MRAIFGDFVFDSATRELACGGESRALSKKAFSLLEILLTNAPKALTKEELYRAIWGDAFVEEVNLSNLITEIRGALGETRKSSRYIKTIHAYGYAFSGQLEIETQTRRQPARFYLSCRPDEFPLRMGANVVGRGDDADIVIDSGAISRRHACITISNDGAVVEDLGSKNGTFVGDHRVTQRTALHDGDVIRIGFISCVFRLRSAGATTVTHLDPGISE